MKYFTKQTIALPVLQHKVHILYWLFLFFFLLYSGRAAEPLHMQKRTDNQLDSISKVANLLFLNKEYVDAIALYEKIVKEKHPDSVAMLKNIAISYAAIEDAKNASLYAEKYIHYTSDVDFPKDIAFNGIKETASFSTLEKTYVPKLSLWSILYLYIAIIGTFVAIILNFKKNTNKISNVLISVFVFMHSLFIINICLYITNYKYYFPHTLLSTASFSFLYGPLLYFYFKKVIQHYTLMPRDFLHLLPIIGYFIYVFPIYSLSASEKLNIMLDEQKISSYVLVTIIAKLLSLLIYGYLIWKIYAVNSKNVFKNSKHIAWQKNILNFYILYTISYVIYALTISNVISIAFLYHTQIIIMSLLVLYVGYMVYVQPDIFGSMISTKNGALLFKYKKSGLTEEYSRELKENLIRLLDEEKIYRNNNINLEMLSEKLQTNRHNTSQVINEHFDINFFELINRYRIYEALEMLKNDNNRKFNIIDIAYEVGFNNKVTFNKAFKKETSLTPTQYVEQLAKNEFIKFKERLADHK